MKKQKKEAEKGMPVFMQGLLQIRKGPLRQFLPNVSVRHGKAYPLRKNDWAYTTSDGTVVLNTERQASAGEWEYVISHCLLHLGLEHIVKERIDDPIWCMACDLMVTAFLKDSHIGNPPPEFREDLPFAVKDEKQAYSWLTTHPEQRKKYNFSTMSGGKADMIWTREMPQSYFSTAFAQSLQGAMQQALYSSSYLTDGTEQQKMPYHWARDWFVSSYPLLGALAASFRIVDDLDTVQRMKIPVAAVSAQLKELYINPTCYLTMEEWQFVLAHEFLHVALRHDARREDRYPILWNVACDYVVNGWLNEMGVGDMPEFALYESAFQGMSVEAVYDIVCGDIRHYTGKAPKDLLYGDEDWWDSLDGGPTDDFYRTAIQQGLDYHCGRNRGDLPAGLVEEIFAASRPPIRWDVQLANWFDAQFAPLEKHRSYARLSRRQSSTPDIPRPAWRTEPDCSVQRIFGVLLDTSGSMDRHLLAAALGSIASYSEAREVHHVRVVFCDAVPYDQGIMAPEEIAGAVKVRGRGGTKLQPGIELLEQDPAFPKEAPLLIITDGDCDRLQLHGREHAYLIPWGKHLPFVPKGPVFRLK